MRKAYFMLKAADIEHGDWSRYALIVCSPNIPEHKVKLLRELSSNAILLAYDNCLDAPDPKWQADYWQKKSALIKPYYIAGAEWWPGSPAYWLDEMLAYRLAEFHAEETMPRGFDGIYLDRSPLVLPERHELPSAYRREDFTYFRQYYTAMLRRNLFGAFLLGNAAGGLRDPMLNGISLESIGSSHSLVEALGIANGAIDVSWRPCNIVGWVRTDEERKAVESLHAIPWMLYGEMRP